MDKQVIDDKVYFSPGDVVILDKEIDNRPLMYVVRKEIKVIRGDKAGESSTNFLGIRCRWFTKDMMVQEAIFDTKDLKVIKSVNNN